jgi:D-xylose transport system ATP-binding protein
MYLGQMAAQVKATDVTHSQVVELITAGRSGQLGLTAPEAAGNGGPVEGAAVDSAGPATENGAHS